ncbi:MAG: endo-1,4-beta-xylanase [Treponema sp.]|nr:endo-1,4-beta-xylanase [Treponema sp.]
MLDPGGIYPQNTTYYISNPVIRIEEVKKNDESWGPDLKLTPLKSIYANDFLVGINSNHEGYNMSGRHFELLKHHYNIITCNVTYAGQIAPPQKGGTYKFYTADRVVNTALRNNIPVHGHVLIWHDAPKWMTEGARSEVEENLKNHITAVLNHYKGKITSWDVVNEAIRHTVTASEARGDWRRLVRSDNKQWDYDPWAGKLGADYIEIAFKAARAADLNITLYYNDYNLENPNRAEVVRKMIQDINDRYKRETGGTRNLIEGVGSQAHIYSLNPNMNEARASLEKLISLGIEVAITEFDIVGDTKGAEPRGHIDTVMPERDQIAQALVYARFMNLYKEYSAHIKRVTFWDIDDNNSWYSALHPALFDWKLNPKQSFYAVSDPDGFLARNGGKKKPCVISLSNFFSKLILA